jgi:hypothetical protein
LRFSPSVASLDWHFCDFFRRVSRLSLSISARSEGTTAQRCDLSRLPDCEVRIVPKCPAFSISRETVLFERFEVRLAFDEAADRLTILPAACLDFLLADLWAFFTLILRPLLLLVRLYPSAWVSRRPTLRLLSYASIRIGLRCLDGVACESRHERPFALLVRSDVNMLSCVAVRSMCRLAWRDTGARLRRLPAIDGHVLLFELLRDILRGRSDRLSSRCARRVSLSSSLVLRMTSISRCFAAIRSSSAQSFRFQMLSSSVRSWLCSTAEECCSVWRRMSRGVGSLVWGPVPRVATACLSKDEFKFCSRNGSVMKLLCGSYFKFESFARRFAEKDWSNGDANYSFSWFPWVRLPSRRPCIMISLRRRS